MWNLGDAPLSPGAAAESQSFNPGKPRHKMRCTTRYYAKICQIDILNVTREESSAIHFSEFSLLLPDYLPFCPCFSTTEQPCCCMFSANKQNLHSPARTRSQKKTTIPTSTFYIIPLFHSSGKLMENQWKSPIFSARPRLSRLVSGRGEMRGRNSWSETYRTPV